jgi:hypothetical protein
MDWSTYRRIAYLGADPSQGRTASSYREHRGPVMLQPAQPVQPTAPRRPHFHDTPPWPQQRYGDYAPVQGWGWWPRWFPYWDRRWYDYWWYLYDYYGGDANADYAAYARDAVLRQYAPQWGLTISGSYGVQAGWSGPILPATAAIVRNYYGLEEALIDGLKRRAVDACARYASDPSIPAVAYLRVKGGQDSALPYPAADWLDVSSPLRQWWQRLTSYGGSNPGSWEFAAIIAFDSRTRQPFVSSYALSPVIASALRMLEGQG